MIKSPQPGTPQVRVDKRPKDIGSPHDCANLSLWEAAIAGGMALHVGRASVWLRDCVAGFAQRPFVHPGGPV